MKLDRIRMVHLEPTLRSDPVPPRLISLIAGQNNMVDDDTQPIQDLLLDLLHPTCDDRKRREAIFDGHFPAPVREVSMPYMDSDPLLKRVKRN